MPFTNGPAYPHDKVAELRDAFLLLDTSGDGFVSMEDIRALLFSMATNMTDTWFDELLRESKLDDMPSVTFAQFFVLITKLSDAKELAVTPKEVRDIGPQFTEVFEPFDPDKTGFIEESLFLSIMSNKGEFFEAQEIGELRFRLQTTGVLREGKVNYRVFVNNLLNEDPSSLAL